LTQAIQLGYDHLEIKNPLFQADVNREWLIGAVVANDAIYFNHLGWR
jgi:hypothetical protein